MSMGATSASAPPAHRLGEAVSFVSSVSSDALDAPLELALTHLVLNVPLPLAGGPAVRYRLAESLWPLTIASAPPRDFPATDYSVGALVAKLEPPALARLFGAALLECQLVIVCDDAGGLGGCRRGK